MDVMRFQPAIRHRRIARAFSLIELLVAMAVLAILMVFLVQMSGSVSNLYRMGKARSEANGVGRTLLDTMTGDIKRAIIRPDLATFEEEDDASARALRFYCLRAGDFRGTNPAVNGLDAARPASIVEYVFYRSGNKQAYLARRDKPCSWNSATNVIPLGQTNAIRPLDATTEESLIYEGVVGAEWNYLRADGSLTNRLGSGAAAPIVGVRYSLALLDADALRLLKEAGKLSEFIQVFNQPGGIAVWETNLHANAGGFPAPAVAGTRFYERFVTLSQRAD